MPSSPVAGSSPQRSNVPWSEPGQISPPASTSQGPQAPPGLPSRSSRDLDAAARPRTPLPTLSAAASFSSDDGMASPGVRASPPRHEETQEAARQRLQAKVQTHAGEVKRLIPFQKIVMDQTRRVEQRLNRARQELATRYPEPEIQPADHTAAQALRSTGQQQAEEQVSLLEWRHRRLGERQQEAAQVLQSAREDLAAAQEQLSALGPPPVLSPPSPTLTPPESPRVSMPGSPTSLAVSHTRSGSAASDATTASQPADPRRESPARLQRRGSELGRDARELDKGKQQRNASDGQITEVPMEGGPRSPAHLDKQDLAEKGVPVARYRTPEKFADTQTRLSAMDAADAPVHPEQTAAPPTSPATPSSPSSPVTPRAHAGSAAASGAAATDQPLDTPQESRARLQRQASELRREVQALEDRLDLKVKETDAKPLIARLNNVTKDCGESDKEITGALWRGGPGAQAHLDKENGRLHQKRLALQKELDSKLGPLPAQLQAAQQNLAAMQKLLDEMDRSVGEAASARPVPRTPSYLPPADTDLSPSDLDELAIALPRNGLALKRLTNRTKRRSPRPTLSTLLRGRPQPLEGKRLEEFERQVAHDVMVVVQQSHLLPTVAANVMLHAVNTGELGSKLTQEDRDQFLSTLQHVRDHLL